MLRDFAILQGGHFGILATGVDNFTIDNLRIDTNRDGMDIDCCRNVHVSNCSVNSPWDDAICLKSSFGLGTARATEMVTITNCLVSGSFALRVAAGWKLQALLPTGERIPRTGRIKFGTESNGGFKNVTISNCVFDGCQGLALETVDGAIFEDVDDYQHHHARHHQRADFHAPGPPHARAGGSAGGRAATGDHQQYRVLEFARRVSGLASSAASRAIRSRTSRSAMCTCSIRAAGPRRSGAIEPPENENAYPEPSMFGAMPSHGFFIRHAKNIQMSNIEIVSLNEDARPAVVLNDVQGADFSHIKIPHVANVPAFVLNNVEDFSVSQSHPLPDTQIDRAEQKKL